MSTYPSTHDRQPPGPIPRQTGLHPRQKKLLTAYNLHTQQHGVPPTIREAMALTGISSSAVAHYHLRRLVKRGLLVHVPGRHCPYRLPRTMQKEPRDS